MIGKRMRLSKIINVSTNRTFIVPMDHGVTMGPIDGLTNTIHSAKMIIEGGADAIILHKGALMELSNYPELLKKCNFILHLSASTNMSKNSNQKHIVSSVEMALKMGAMGVSAHVNLGTDNDGDMISDLGRLSDACLDWGMPLIAMMYVRGENLDSMDMKNIAHAAKVAEELGADIVKVNAPHCPSDIEGIVHSVGIPVVVSGGPKTSDSEILAHVDAVLKAGASGVSIGRNIFQSARPRKLASIIYNMVHNNMSYKDAMLSMSDDFSLSKIY